jgi:opacity protein-like surface antigen
MKTKLLASAVLAALFVAPVQAQQTYIGLDLGVASVDRSSEQSRDLDAALAITGAPLATSTVEQRSGLFRVHLGHFISDNLSLELGYFSSGSFDGSYSAGGERIKTETKISGFDVSANYYIGNFFVKGGLHNTKADFDAKSDSGDSVSFDKTSTGLLLGLGYQNQLAENLDYRISYTYMNGIKTPSLSTIFGRENDQDFGFLTAGLIYKF